MSCGACSSSSIRASSERRRRSRPRRSDGRRPSPRSLRSWLARSAPSSCAGPKVRSRRSCRSGASRPSNASSKGPQRRLYEQLRAHYRQSLLARISKSGINKSKIQVLEALLRLRQAACHPALVDEARRGDSSAKLDVLVPRLDRGRGGGAQGARLLPVHELSRAGPRPSRRRRHRLRVPGRPDARSGDAGCAVPGRSGRARCS